MAAVDPVLPPEEVALLELGKVALDKVPPAPDEHLGDPDATLPWDRCQHNAQGQPELLETKRRSSPEGGHEDPEEAVPTCLTVEAKDEEVPQLPVMAAHIFVPIDPQCIEQSHLKQKQHPTPWPREESREDHASHSDKSSSLHHKQVFLPLGPSRYQNPLGFEGRTAKLPAEGLQCPCARGCGTDNLKAMASVVGALLLCPCLIYGAYIFLPFDAPLLPTISARLVYTLRCAAFATFPIVLGEPWAWGMSTFLLLWAALALGLQEQSWGSVLCGSDAPTRSSRWSFSPLLVLPKPHHGSSGQLNPSLCPSGMIVSAISRLCSSALEPFGELHREVEIHRTYVSQSVHLFILYFFNMAVLATYLPQELLKLIPLLTGLFAISR